MAGAHVLVGVRAELASAFLLEDSLSVLEQVAELDGMLGTSLCSWPGAAPVIRNRLQLQPELCLLPRSCWELSCREIFSNVFFLFFFFLGTGRSFRKTARLGTPPSSLSLITAREEVVITTHLPVPRPQVKSEQGNMHAAQRSVGASAGHGYPAGTQGRTGTAVPASCYGSWAGAGDSSVLLAMSIISVLSKLPRKLVLKISSGVSSLALRACS